MPTEGEQDKIDELSKHNDASYPDLDDNDDVARVFVVSHQVL